MYLAQLLFTQAHQLVVQIDGLKRLHKQRVPAAAGAVNHSVHLALLAGDDRHRVRQHLGPARDVPHVFDKFYRVQSDATASIPGTGLGLAITKSIVEAHAGRIGVESIEGAGSTFWVDLPSAPGGGQAA